MRLETVDTVDTVDSRPQILKLAKLNIHSSSCGCQAFAGALLSTFGNDQFCKMLKEPADYRELFINVTNALLESFETLQAANRMQSMPDSLKSGVNEIARVCLAISTLVSAVPPKDASIGDVTSLRELKVSGNFIMTTIVDALVKTPFWKKMYDELLSKGTATIEARPVLEDFLSRLGDVTSQEDLIPEALLQELMKKLPELQKATRPGFLSILEREMQIALQQTAAKIKDDSNVSITMSYLSLVMEALSMFKHPASMTLVTALNKYKVKQSQGLLLADLTKLLEPYPEGESNSDRFHHTFDFEDALKALHRTLRECKDANFTTEVTDGLRKATFWHFRSLYMRLRDIQLH